ncbi:hypothetical protein H072_6937 [Dactylellina haptotyla CBS 200.50]|uniref:Uncharacterized protein n=1 Tax=Dactylellina haptotyla (strain CBS 200.50) TaxID=1284197 RepID=S8A8G1_DACHA|nr:hypothetical protein H072_6937 [Dactylellina haptotyla CBS 200.50]
MAELSHSYHSFEGEQDANGRSNLIGKRVGTVDSADGVRSSKASQSRSAASPQNSRASTLPILPRNLARRRILSAETFDENARPYRRASAGAPQTAIQTLPHADDNHTVRTDPNTPLDIQKENRKASIALKRQLECFKKSSISVSEPPSQVTTAQELFSPAWSITSNSIAIKKSRPVQSLTTNLWELREEEAVTPEGLVNDSSEPQSEYLSFPAYESFPKTSRPGLRTRCSDKSWFLLQRLKGKIVDIHNGGQRSGRSSSQTSISSRKSSRSPGRSLKQHHQSGRTRRRRASDGEQTSRPNLNPHVLNENCQQNTPTVAGGILKSPAKHQKRSSQDPSLSLTAQPDNHSNKETRETSKHVRIESPESREISGDRNQQESIVQGKPSPLVGFAQGVASSLYQSLVTIATGDSAPATTLKRLIGVETTTKVRSIDISSDKRARERGPKFKSNKNPEDSSDEEMNFMEYVKRFAGSPPSGERLASPTMGNSSRDGMPEWFSLSNETVPRSMQPDEPTRVPNSPPQTLTPVPEDTNVIPLEAASDTLNKPAPVNYKAQDYEIITTYFYNTQTRLLNAKWPFLLENEIKHLIDTKWLEMEWEDLEDWARESAKHVDEIGYIEPDLFEDISLVDPRRLT